MLIGNIVDLNVISMIFPLTKLYSLGSVSCDLTSLSPVAILLNSTSFMFLELSRASLPHYLRSSFLQYLRNLECITSDILSLLT